MVRPLVVMQSYGTGTDAIQPGQQFDLSVELVNNGAVGATNLIATFESTDFFPRDTGGVQAVSGLATGGNVHLTQPMTASTSLSGNVAPVTVSLSYSDASGGTYTSSFTLTINLKNAYGGYGAAAPTRTPTTMPRPQLVVSAYQSDVDPLQPGSVFNLSLEVRNLGTADARAVTMVLGGGAGDDNIGSGTPSPGGLSGSSGDLANFAPLGSSNLFYLGDVVTGAVIEASQRLIVNVSTEPGAYTLKLSFVYTDAQGGRHVDDQVITLLVYSLPHVEVNFYRDPGVFYVGQPNQVPLQVTNLGRSNTVLGNLKMTAPNAEVSNNVSLVGALDPGGYFTLDAMVIPSQAGPLELEVLINYTDDFNQARSITQTLSVDVQDAPEMGMGGMPGEVGPAGGGQLPVDMLPEPATETVWQKVLRALKGLVGLDSGAEQPQAPLMEMPTEEMQSAPPVKVMPVG
ncbi:MAG: hypothetical protein VB089_03675 [Anaerolineaceae bacterium]|nr:hypothetical protein [Anaerolineaceae bacterium]